MKRLIFIWLVMGCLGLKGQGLLDLLKSDTSEIIQKVLKDSAKYRLQIIYTKIEKTSSFLKRDRSNLITEYIRNKPEEYFFPASLVKMPVAALALEKLNELKVFGVNEYTPFAPLSDFQCNKSDVPSAPLTTHDLIDKIFVYSDNHAFNYLYELCGQAFINRRLQQLGYSNARIIEKISRCNTLQNGETGPVVFYDNQKTLHIEGRQMPISLKQVSVNMKIGKGYLWNGKYVSSPKDFSTSNVVTLSDFHQMLISFVLPEKVKDNQRFLISESQRKGLLESMCKLPSEYYPDSCNKQTFKDTHVKYLMGYRDSIPSHWKIYNKVGLAHGFISDCTYFEDKEKDISFFLSAVIYVNEDNILNDGKYEYYSVGFPFMRALGKLVYNYELQMKGNKN
ncbi:MAG: serine hydrolase [Opitutaceae bacterium]|nr:serine hydrolase [Cytophagales bacterium]